MVSTVRKEQKEATAAKMKATAAALFQERGYEHVTIRDVAGAAGMSTGAVFSTFLDKDDMFLKSIGRQAPTIRLKPFLTDLKNTDPYDLAGAFLKEAALLLSDFYGEPQQ